MFRKITSITNYLKLGLLIVLNSVVLSSQASPLERHIFVNGKDRSYIVYLPENAQQKNNLSVIFAFHPFLGSGKGFFEQTGFSGLPEASNFIFVFPNGYRRSWNAEECCGAAVKKNINDVEFVKEIFKDLQRFVSVSKEHNFAVGFSNGAMFSQKLVCHMSERFAGFAVSGGLYKLDGSCYLKRPVSALFMSGLEDPFAPFDGGESLAGGGERPGVPYVSEAWAKKESCKSQYQTSLVKDVSCMGYGECLGGSRIISCPIPRMGHWWPGQKGNSFAKKKFGPDRPDLPISREVLKFFLSLLS
ncbi:alpha/beta hydrolase family esterase [Thiomicrorhabdus heinhorstiae]|uniref:Polyhydroxybutyrate depolymerase n=1 Tax=Thiomicrorhabdus heinhorstiae TaxID=2748010 RepID=A0ABS0BVH9_9GAMM|nr:hypothetical protein [Thiomicrorhabdus heinhorstiae]MBF6057068.1 hypothetical protein [Thiomicrorhabdus heinhorstiae]